jgi:hypothetical protein
MDLSAIIRKAIEIGDRHGFITFDQIDELVPSSADRPESETIEAFFEALSARGIDFRERRKAAALGSLTPACARTHRCKIYLK